MFVCTGNICRSPLAEGILRKLAKGRGLDWEIASSGIESYHAGESPDYRAIKVAKFHNINLQEIKAQMFKRGDFEEYDYIFAMAAKHERALLKYSPEEMKGKIHLLLQFTNTENFWKDDVMDPYYGAEEDFKEVYEVLLKSCETLIEKILKDQSK